LYTKYEATPITKESDYYCYSQIVETWIKKLGLQEEPIFTLFEEKGDNLFSRSKVIWNPLKNYWEIKYKYPQKEYTIIHELGHIYLHKLDGNLEYKKKQKLTLTNNVELWKLVNWWEDLFVNMELRKFPEFYELCKKQEREFTQPKPWNYSHYFLPKSKDRVSYIRNRVYQKLSISKDELNEFLKRKYGMLCNFS
jgi:hypothetical protein